MQSFDHFVLVTEELEDARAHYRKMGFTVAPNGVHPFGTYNANMYFSDGPMIETLAIMDAGACSEAIAGGNTFVANDAAFRAAVGSSGFSHIVLTSEDADADHAGFQTDGVSGGDLVSFTRKFEQPDGSLGTVSVKLAFAKPPETRAAFYFTCEDIIMPDVDRSLLLEHANGALGAKRVISCAANPSRYAEFLEGLFGEDAVYADDDGVDGTVANGRASIVTPDVLAREYGVPHGQDRPDLLHRGLVFAVEDIKRTETLFTENEVAFNRHNDRLVTQIVPKPGVFFAFEQID